MTLKPDSQPIPLRFALYTSSQGNYFFNEIRDLIAAGLKELGVTVEYRDERNGFDPQVDWHLVISPHEFFVLGAGKDLAAGLWPTNLVLFNTEKPSSDWLALSAKYFDRAAAIWDIDFDSTLRICKRGYACDYLPLGHVANSAMFHEVSQLPLIEETRHLSSEVRDQPGFRQLFNMRPIDLLFGGYGSPRAERHYAQHADRFKKFNTFFHKSAGVCTMILGQTTKMNTVVSAGLSQRSKILLNIHHGVDSYFEWDRIVLLGIAQRTLVVTEPCSVAPPFQANIDYVEAPFNELPDLINYYLGSPTGQVEAQRIIEHGLETLTVRCRLSARLRTLVEQLNRPAAKRSSSDEHYFPASAAIVKTRATLSLCVVTPDVAGEGPHADYGSAQVALAEMLVKAGHQVALLHTEGFYGQGLSASHWRKHFAARGIDYVLLPANRRIPLESTDPCCRSYEAYLWLKEKSFAAVHFPEARGIGFYCLLAKRQGLGFFQTRFCVHAHGPQAWRRDASQQFLNQHIALELDFLEQECLRHADALATSTRFMRGWLEHQKWPLPAERQLCPTPVVRTSTALVNDITPIHELVYLGLLGEGPALKLFCDALDRLESSLPSGTTILFVDDSSTVISPRTQAYLQERASQWTFAWRIASFAPATRPNNLRQKARLVILPSPQENSPVNVRRCLALEVPFLAAACAGVAELIHPDDRAMALYDGTAAGLAEAIQKALREGIRPANPAAQQELIERWLQWHQDWAAGVHPPIATMNEPLPLVSVCLIHFDRPEFLAQALASLRAQDYPHFELVLVDDGSTKPESVAFLKSLELEFKQRNWQIVRQENRYLGAARNNAARHARGEYLIFMDDDNFAKPHQLSTFVRVARTTGADIVTSAMDLFTGTDAPQLEREPKARWIFLGGAAAIGAFRNCFGDANGCIRRETFLHLGGFTEDYGITHEDWEFYARAVLQGCRLETTPEALFHYRVTDCSMIRSTPRFANHLRSLRPYLAAVPEPLRGLVHFAQGSVLFPTEENVPNPFTGNPVPNPGLEILQQTNHRMATIAKELISTGQNAAAEAIFLEILRLAGATQQSAIILQTMLVIGSALVEKKCGSTAEDVLARAVAIAKDLNNSTALKEAEYLLATARNICTNEKKSPSKNFALASPPLMNPTDFNSKGSTLASLGRIRPANPLTLPLVSIIIPVFNRLDLTRPCLEAIHRETAPGTFEIIVVDNASSDGTYEFLVAEQLTERLRTIRNEQNLGFSKACNQGILAARGGLILLLNNDTIPLAGWLEAMRDEIETSSQIGVVGSCLLYPGGELIQHAGVRIGSGGGLVHPYHPWRLQRLDRVPAARESRDCQVVTAGCCLIRRTVLDEVGLFDEGYVNGFEDVDLCFRIRQAGYRIRYCASSRVIHYESMTPGRNMHEQANYNRLNGRWKAIIKPDESPEETRLNTVEILCHERLLNEPGNLRALATLAQICNRRKDFKQEEEWRAQWMTKTQDGKAVPVSVSIVIPVLNNFALTKKCVQAIEDTVGFISAEVIVVDNGSTDGTQEFLREAKHKGRLNFIRNESNLGFARACNQGAQAANGSLLLFLNNDTQVTPGWLDALTQAAGRPDVGIVGAKLLYANNTIQHAGIGWINGVPDHPHRHAHPLAPEVNTRRELDMVTGACLLIPRELFRQLAGFDEIYQNGVEDIDLCLRARAAGRKVIYEPKAVIYHLEGQSVGRFSHVNENLKLFFNRWQSSFDQHRHFIVPQPPKIIAASRSRLLKSLPSGAPPATIDWIGSFLDHGSLSHVNRELTGALQAFSDFQVNRISNGAPSAPGFEVQARDIHTTVSPNAAITVRHAWPPNWQRPAQGKLVVIQPWEFGSLPADWVRQSRDVDEFWVPSEYVRQVYVESGVPAKKVLVVPNGIDPNRFNPQATPLKLATQKQFKFLFVGGTIGRKGPDLLLQAYLKNFTATDDVCLVIKDFGGKSFYAGQTFESQIRAAQALPDAPEILYLNTELPPESLPGLYTACDCLVLPYRGEGFGLPVLEAMACGLPIIVSAGGATDDFVRDEFAWRIPAGRKFFGNEVSGLKLAGKGWLLEPDSIALGKHLRHAFESPAEARERGLLASHHARQNFSWKNSAATAVQRLHELTTAQTGSANSTPQKPPPAKPVPVKTPSVALVGQLHEARKLFGQKKLPAAWNATLSAIGKRPFHPEAFLLLAEIALAAGDAASARECAKHARDLAPGWNPAKQFLKKSLKGSQKPEWLQLPQKNQNRLSVCLIVKNEEKFLDQCLQSVRDLAWQIVVVDTGSTDRTLEIARSHGVEIHSFAWGDDFSTARNAALEQATGDWVLILDADEELPAEQHPRLRADMARAEVLACRLPLVSREHEAEGQSFVPRLFRNVPGIFYTGRIHEQIFPSLVPFSKSWGLNLDFGTAQLLHHGYTKELVRDRNKIKRNLELLTRAVQENPQDANLMMNFGLELVRLEDLAGGVEKYREAFKLMSAQKEEATAPELREVLLTQFTCQLYKIRAHEEVVQVLHSPLAETGGLTASLHFALGLALFELKQYAAAAEQMRQCISQRHEPVLAPRNTDTLTAAPEHCLALSLAKTGDAAGAEKAFLAALAGQGKLDDVKLDYAKFLAAQNRSVDAFHKLHELVAANSRNLAAWRTGGEIALSRAEFLEFAGNWTGEAMRYVAEDFIVNRQRAEVLLLNGDAKTAAELWERLWNSERQPTILAALILCETLGSQLKHAPDKIVDEPATSRAFIKWYQRLIAMRAYAVVKRVNEQLDKLSDTLPTAAGMLGKALAEPQQA